MNWPSLLAGVALRLLTASMAAGGTMVSGLFLILRAFSS